MKNKLFGYLGLVLLHLVLGLVIFYEPLVAMVYAVVLVFGGIYYVLKTGNRNHEVLLIAAYIVGTEVFLRMTGGNPIHEMAKYLVIAFMLIGIFYKSFSPKGLVYLFFLLLLLPGVIIGLQELSPESNPRKVIAFNMSGPVALVMAALYCFDKTISSATLYKLLIAIGMPIISMTVYLILYNPDVQSVIVNAASNFDTSGGFGPNQVSTALGLGMFVFFTLFLLYSKSKVILFLNLGLVGIMTFRGIVTFSRGGVFTAIVAIVLLVIVVSFYLSIKGKFKLVIVVGGSIFISLSIWSYTLIQTNGFIENRYANKDSQGREKKDRLGGREAISKQELQIFWDNPISGAGVGKSKDLRAEQTGKVAAAHNEVTRLLAEHGIFGLLGLLLLAVVPLLHYYHNRQHLLLLSFYFFWALTINHAAMRIAAPGFIYALTLLKINWGTKSEEKKGVQPIKK